MLRAELAVFVEKAGEDRASLRPVLIKEVSPALAQAVCTLLTRVQRRVECKMTKKIKRIGIGLV
ncbi:hypothetical protein FQZ97_1107200 [compost metagenome]